MGFAPGGGTDTFARPFAAKLSQELGQQVVIDNRAGAGGTVGAAIVAKAKSDADQHRQDTEGPLVKRAEQLTREQNLLRQRREALMAQLNNLSSLANRTALEFPDEDGNHPVHEVLTTEAVDDPVENTVERKPKADPSTTKANEDA